MVAGVEGVDGLELEVVERERVAGDDLGPRGGVHGGHGVSLRQVTASRRRVRRWNSRPIEVGDEVEDRHRDGQREQRDRVARRRDHGGHDDDDDQRVAPAADQRLRRQHADELQEHEQHGELEADAERGDHQADEADVLADLEQGADVGAAPGDEELDRLAEGQVGDQAAEQEQEDRRGDERDRVALLLGVQRRDDEAPDLPQHDGHGEDQPAVRGDAQARREAVDRVEDEQRVARGVEGVEAAELDAALAPLALAQVDVRLREEVEDLVVEGDDDDRRRA